jgi:hypothetical protein
VLGEHDYLYFEVLVRLFRFLADIEIDVADAAAGVVDPALAPSEQVARLLAALDEIVDALQLKRRRDGLDEADPERTWIVELDNHLRRLRDAIDRIRELLAQNPGAPGALEALLRDVTEAGNGARQNLDRILDGLPDYDGDGVKNGEELGRGQDPLAAPPPDAAPPSGSAPPK